MAEIVLGGQYRDRLTGFTGVATGRCEYLEGTPRVLLAVVKQDGSLIEEWFDQGRLVVWRED